MIVNRGSSFFFYFSKSAANLGCGQRIACELGTMGKKVLSIHLKATVNLIGFLAAFQTKLHMYS